MDEELLTKELIEKDIQESHHFWDAMQETPGIPYGGLSELFRG